MEIYISEGDTKIYFYQTQKVVINMKKTTI